LSSRRAGPLETVFVRVPEDALEAYEGALAVACATLGFFLDDEDTRIWRVEGVKPVGEKDDELNASLAVAAMLSGHTATLLRCPTAAEGWLAKVHTAFPEQRIGRRFAIRGTHLPRARALGTITLTIDAGLAFGSGEHGSTRGCLRALERIAHRRPARVMDMGTGSGVLAMGAAALLKRTVDAVDNDPWSVRVTRDNAALNGLRNRMRVRLGNGWHGVRNGARYELIFANILARPLCLMAPRLAAHLAPGGTVILAGLLSSQINAVLAAHRRQGLRLECILREENWATLVLRS
jgi:ribosomal protein L11 methyltransferase